MERLTDSLRRDVFARMRVRIQELERENAELKSQAGREGSPGAYRWPQVLNRYETEEDRLEARRRVWRESKRRAKLRNLAA